MYSSPVSRTPSINFPVQLTPTRTSEQAQPVLTCAFYSITMGSWWSALGWWDNAVSLSDKGVQVGSGLVGLEGDVGQVGVAVGDHGLNWGVPGSVRWKKKRDVLIPVWSAQTAPLPSPLTFQPIVVTPSPNANNSPTSDCSEPPAAGLLLTPTRPRSNSTSPVPPEIRFAQSLSEKVALFNQHVNLHNKKQELNPFSDRSGSKSPRPTFSKEDYGKPPPGSESEYRAIKGRIAMNKDILELCEVINIEGELQIVDGTPVKVILFRDLFQMYTVINDKLVGLLLRARKQGMVDFEGETLFQRRDDHVLIGLILPIQEIREIFRKRNEELNEQLRVNKEIAASQNVLR